MDLDESLDAESQWVAFKHPMEESLVAVSEKVSFQNASAVNRAQLERAKKLMKVEEEPLEDTQNEFLEVGKWRKNKESALSQEMASVRNEVQMGMTSTKINASQKSIKDKGKEREKEKEEVIADESICPDEQQKEEEDIEDQTMQGDEEQQEDDQQEEEQQQEQQEQDQQEEQEEQEQQQDEQEEQEQEQSGAQEQQKREPPPSQEYDDDKTDTQSQMKRTEYLPSKWTKKSQTSSSLSQWQRKEAILKRILLLVK